VEALDAGDVVTDSFNYQVSAGGRTGSSDIDQAVITITVIGVNDAPTLASMSNVSLAESVSSGTSVATASGSDVDASASLTYSITSGNSAGKFAINSSTGAITTAASLDYETTTSYTLTVQVSDGSLTATTNQVVNITDVAETTQVQGTTNSGTAASVWGASYSADAVLNNAWAESKILSIGRHTNTNPDTYGGTTIFEDMGYTVARHGTTKIDNWSRKQLTQYEQIWDFQINDTSLTTAEKNQWKTYLRDGGVIGMIGENSSWDNKKNAVIEDFLDDIDSAVSSSSSMISGNSYTNGSTGSEAHTIGAAYNVHDNSDGEGTGSAYTVARGSGLAAAGQFHEDYMGDGSLIATNQSDTDAGFIAEWGGDVTDAGYIGTFIGVLDIRTYGNAGYGDKGMMYDLLDWAEDEAQAITGGIVTDTEYLPIGGLKTTYGWTNTSNNTKSSVEAYHMGNNVYIGGGFDHLDWVWDDSANAAFVAVNSDMDGSSTSDAPTRQDDHYLVIAADTDGDANLYEQGDVFDLDKIGLWDNSEDFLIQDDDASGDYYFKITPVTYANSSWTVETDNTVTIADTTDYYNTGYINLMSNSDFQDINYAIIETESALISDVYVTY
jgi:hypothetical protein